MKDYAQNYKSGNDRRFDRNNRQYDHPQYIGFDRQNGNHRRKGSQRKTEIPELLQTFSKETMPVIKNILEGIAESQKRLADAQEIRAKAEERKADAMESIAEHLKHLIIPCVFQSEDEKIAVKSVSDPKSTKNQEGKTVNVDRDDVIQIIKKMHKSGSSYGQIALHLEKEKISTFSGRGKWHGQTVHRLLKQSTT